MLSFARKPAVLASTLIGTVMFAQGTQPPPPAAPTEKPVAIVVDLASMIGAYNPIYSWFGYDEGNFTTMHDGRRLLRELHDLSPVPVYIRAHHLLTSGKGEADAELKWSSTNVYQEDGNGKPVYDFKIMDAIFDGYKDAGVRPMVELGFMPRDLAAKLLSKPDLPYQVHYPQSTVSGASNNPPKDYAIWGELVRVVTAHLVERYGREAVLQWPFEVWNEPDIDYWHSTAQDYWKLYDFAVAGVRAALPGAKVGGPANTGPGNAHASRFMEQFLEHVNTGKSAADGKTVPLDFISFHVKGAPKIVEGDVTMSVAHELTDAEKGFEIIARFPKFKHLPIILSEADPEGCAACSSKVNPANNYRNGTLYPAYTAVAYKGLFELQDKWGVNLLSMLSWSFEFEDKDYFEGFRTLSTNGVDKPVLNFFRMAALMNGRRVATTSDGKVPLEVLTSTGVRVQPDVDALATRGERQAAVMVWNYHDVDGAGPEVPTMVAVSGLPNGIRRVLVTHYRIDDTHSNAYTIWKAMGSPQHPTTEQYARLQGGAGLQLLNSPQWLDVISGEVRVATSMPRQSVSLLQFTW